MSRVSFAHTHTALARERLLLGLLAGEYAARRIAGRNGVGLGVGLRAAQQRHLPAHHWPHHRL